jgi:phosphoadenosine phosphosulfate reductase
MPNHFDVVKANDELLNLSPEKILEWAVNEFGDELVFASSFGAEDMVLIDMISKINPSLKIITLDTGRLHEETYDLMEKTRNKYKLNLEVYFPSPDEVENLVNSKGLYSFRESISNRKECCRIRKVIPLRKALNGFDAWITGMRKEQSVTRENVNHIEIDEVFGGIVKINPLLNWTEKEVWDYIRKNNVIYNLLHDKGFPSIGCAPCTRAIKKGEPTRNGRWWWESQESKECGLHKK